MAGEATVLIIRCTLLAIAICCTIVLGGCASSHKRTSAPPQFAAPLSRASLADSKSPDAIEVSYAKAIALEEQDSAECVDWYLRSARMLWPQVACNAVDSNSREIELYRSSVGKLIETGQRYDRFDPVKGIALPGSNALEINRSQRADSVDRTLPVRYYDFAWQPSDFQAISVVGRYRTPDVIQPHQQPGVGVPLLVQTTSPDSLILRNATFAATAIVRPDNEHSTVDDNSTFILDIINPNTIRKMRINGQSCAIAYDLTAPLAYFSVNDHDYDWLKGLIRPEAVQDKTGLTMVEPYRRGRIPVVFVHGLASEPMTWAAMANELSKFTDLMEDYQFWIFSYPTGTPFPREAASLRHQLVALREHIDPDRSDTALDRLVLIGHSMGGLISKLQITSSGDRLSRTISSSRWKNWTCRQRCEAD